MKLTKDESFELKLQLFSGDPEKDTTYVVEKSKYQIDVNGLQKATPSTFGDVLYEKININEKITVKSVVNITK